MITPVYIALSDCIYEHITGTNALRAEYEPDKTEQNQEVVLHEATLKDNHAKALEIVSEQKFTKVELYKEVKQANTDKYTALAKEDAEGVRRCELTAHFFRTLICRM